MKKVLLASAALLALSTVAQAAEPVKLSIGGYATQWIGVASNQDSAVIANSTGPAGGYGSGVATGVNPASPTVSSAADHRTGFDVQDDVNINFVGSTKLDNGITIGVEVDTFGSQRADTRTNVAGNTNTKRSFITIGSAFGTAIVGEREDALYIVHNSAPDVGVGLQDGSWFQWVANPAHHKLYSATNTSRYDDRTNKISYVTPSYYGFAAAASYVPDISRNGGGGQTGIPSSSDTSSITSINYGHVSGTDFGQGDLYGAGVAYAGTIGDVSIKADAGFGQANIANLRVYQGGTQVSYAGFTLGGSILNRSVDNKASLAGYAGGTAGSGTTTQGLQAQSAAFAGQSWDLGLAYATGPYSVSLGYFHDTTKKDDASAGTGTAVRAGYAADSTNVYLLSGKYVMGPGVALLASAGRVEYKTKDGFAADQNKGWLGVTGVRVDF
jgi:hypothetical protein